jgi:hypothetical protein
MDDPNPTEIGAVPATAQRAVPAHVPEDVGRFYVDAKRVMDAGVPDAAAVELRRTLEAAAAHHGIDSGGLVERIEKLISQGLITSEFGKVLHHVRQVGNIGAHATDERLSDETVERAFRFTTQVLINLFEIPAELAALDAAAQQAGESVGP